MTNKFNAMKVWIRKTMKQDILKIEETRAGEILDCRGNPTVQADVWTKSGFLGRADAPSGKSRGEYEAFELRDGGDRFEDRWIDYFISLESLYSKASELTEVTHRLATRVSRTLESHSTSDRKFGTR